MKKFLLLLLIVALSAASIDVRFVHVAYNTSSLDILINGNTVATDIAYDTITPYLHTESGLFHVEIVDHADTKVVYFNGTIDFPDMKSYTVFAVGSNDLAPVVVEDNNLAPADQWTARVRFFQGVSDVATADILSNGNVIATLNYKAETNPYVALPAGTYTIAFKVHGAASPIYSAPFTVAGGQVYTGIFSGVTTAVAFIHTSDIAYTYFGVKVAHLSPDAPAVDVYLNNDKTNASTKIVPNLAYKAVSDYITFAAVTGDAYSTIVTAVNTNHTLSSSTFTVAAGTVTTVSLVGLVANGSPTPFHIVYLPDNNVAPADSWSNRVRFFPALLPNTVILSVSMNGQVIFSNVDFATVTPYAVVKTGTYTVAISSGEDQIATANFDLVGGGVYTIFAEGLVGSNLTQTPSISMNADAKFTYFTVRTANAAPGVPTATFALKDVHGQPVFSFGDVTYGLTTPYTTLPVQDLTLDVMSGENTTYSQQFAFKTGDLTTVTLFGVTGKYKAINFPDTNTAPKSSTVANVRFIHAVVDGPAVDVKFAGKTQFPGVAYETATGYVQVDAGTYQIGIFSGAVNLLTIEHTFVGGGVYTIIAEGIAGANNTITAPVSTDVTYEYFQLRFTHAASNAGNVDVILDDGFVSSTAFGNVAYQASVGYSELVLSNFTLKVTPAGNKNTVLITAHPGFVANGFYTVSMFGLLAGPNVTTPLTSLVIKDTNAAPADSHTARLRFLNAVAGGPSVDVLFNDKIVFPDVPYGHFVDYVNVGADVYRIDLYEANTNNHLQALNNYQIIGGQETTVVAMGTPGHIVIVPYNYYQYTYFQLRFVHTSPDAGTVSVSLEGETIWDAISFGNVTAFKEFTSDKKNLVVATNGDPILTSDQAFTVGAGSTALLVGLKHVNATAPLALLINVEKPTIPTSNTVASLRIIHTSPDSPAFDVKLNNTVQFNGVQYKQITDYKEIAAGIYTIDVAFNHSVLAPTQITLTGGFAYTVFIEGLIGDLKLDHSIDFIPPSTGYLRFLHASPDTAPVDLLVNGSADYRNVAFESGSDYEPYLEGLHDLRIVPTDQRVPTLALAQVNIMKDTWSSVLFIGLQNKTENTTSTLEAWVLADVHELPAAGDILIRFIHASPNAPALDIRANGVAVFSGVTYKNVTTYHLMNGNTYNVELFETGKTNVLLASKFDLSVPAKEAAIYTLVAEGLYGKDLKIVSFLDNGSAPPKPPQPSPSGKPGLSGVAIGLIVAAVVIVVIAAAAGGYVIWRRKRRAGYSEIATHEH